MFISERLNLLDEVRSSIGQVKANNSIASEGPLKDLIASSGAIYRSVSGAVLADLSSETTDLKADIAKDFDEGQLVITNAIAEVKADVKSQIVTDLNDTSGTIFDTILNILRVVVSSIGNLAGGISNLKDQIIDGVQNVIEDITGGIGDLINALKAKMQALVDGVATLGRTIRDGLTDAVANIGNWIRTNVNAVITGVGSWIATQINSAKDWLADTYGNVRDWIVGTYHNVAAWLTDTYNAARDNVLAAVEGFKIFAGQVGATIQDKIDDLLAWFQQVGATIQAEFNQLLAGVSQWINTEVLPRITTLTEGAQGVIDLFSGVWAKLSAGDYEGAFDMLDGFAQGLGIPAPIATLHAILSAFAYFQMTIQLQFIPAQVSAQKRANIALGLDPVPLQSVAAAFFKGQASEAAFYDNAKLAGVTPERARYVLEATKNIPPAGAIQEAFLRGEVTEEEHDRLLKSYGYEDSDIALFKALYFIIPPPNDLIRMAVREAFSPDIAERFGQYEDFPAAFTEWALKIGLTEDWAKRYWAAHWDLPSPQMGFEMLHRGVISNEELTLLLRALDVMPFWREKLIKISYNPLTRVDVRRMFQLGVIDEAQVYASYLDLGYDTQKATWLTEFTKRYSAPEDESELTQFKALARSTYSQAYQRKLISKDEYKAFLANLKYYPDDIELLVQLDDIKTLQDDKLFDIQDYRKDFLKLSLQAYDRGLLNSLDLHPLLLDLGYSEGEITLELSLADYNRELTIRNLLVSRIHDQYVDYIIDMTGVYEILNMFNFSHEEVAKLQEVWDIERNFRTKRPTLTDLKRFMTQGLITVEQFLEELRGQGYHEKYIGLYEQSLALGKG